MPGATQYWTKKEGELEKSFIRLELEGVDGSWGAIRLRCEANLFKLFRANSLEVSVKPDVPQPASVLLMGSSQTNGKHSIFLTKIINSSSIIFFRRFKDFPQEYAHFSNGNGTSEITVLVRSSTKKDVTIEY